MKWCFGFLLLRVKSLCRLMVNGVRNATGLASVQRSHFSHSFFCQVAEAVLTSQLKAHQEKPNFIIKIPKVIPFAYPIPLECLGGLTSALHVSLTPFNVLYILKICTILEILGGAHSHLNSVDFSSRPEIT